MKKDINIFLEHILEAIYLIEEYIKDKSKSEFLKLRQLQDSVIRRIEIIGEAIKNIPNDFKETYPKKKKKYLKFNEVLPISFQFFFHKVSNMINCP